MKAWQFTGTNKPLELNEVPEPTAGPGQVVVTVRVAGVCHSDVSALDDEGWMGLFPTLPRTMGHENAGVITEVGEGMDHWKVGDRVGLAPMFSDGDALGYGKWDGGFGPKLLATDDNLVKLPDEVSFELGAMATDAGLTAYHAIMTLGEVKKGTKVGVIGLGGLGYIGARVAVLSGAEVYGADLSLAARELADEIGLAGVGESIEEFADKGLEVVVDYAGFGVTTESGVNALSKFGVFVQVGMGKLEARLDTLQLITKQLTVKGSNSGTKEDLENLYELMRSGDLNPPVNLITHAEIPEAIDRLREGGVVGRLIAVYDEAQ
ncbi:alcohol dehydrogenase catalytic domain-containing protein [Leucobacter denitrificans]|uniref:alcohol dehydrogenase n=1 Tax=Leucobacter denitrificans TaxID=683042 RepID=A0A7G9S2M6_9MICO|nr:alcohol dehydrogenase catalytic domain-containing protein [Leucobacter denitrificans]QNN62101.1 alcohol dehydrogenase catalytic domain-containing protein [Leucobacter denitrificans]